MSTSGADPTLVERVLREACGCRPEIASFKCAACRAADEIEALRAAVLRAEAERDEAQTRFAREREHAEWVQEQCNAAQADYERTVAERDALAAALREIETIASSPTEYGVARHAVLAAARRALEGAPEQDSRQRALAAALRDWWESKRPVGWTVEQHAANPTVNCVTEAEKRLARALHPHPETPSHE